MATGGYEYTNDEYVKIVMSYLSWHCSDVALILSTGVTTILEKFLSAKTPRGTCWRQPTATKLTTTNTEPTRPTTDTTMTPPTTTPTLTDTT